MADKEKNGNGMPTDAGTNKEWLRAVVNDKVEKATTWTSKETRDMGPKRPGSRLQEILQGFYWHLVDKLKEVKFTEGGEIITAPAEDSFDKWYENMELETYAQKPKLMDVFNTIARMCQVPEAEGYEEEDFQSMLSHIMNRCMDEDEYLEVIARVINERYPGLASPFRSTPTVEEMQEYEDLLYRRRLDEVRFNIDTNIEEFAEELQKIEAAAKTDFEILARQLNELVIFGTDAWELTLYCLMSPNAPRFIMNGLDYRSCIHEMLAGDISTAKSKVHKIAKMIAPKMLVVDDTTKPTFEGVAPTKSGGEIEEGVVDWANDGVMIVEEFTRTFSKMPLFRRVMDGEPIEIYKKGSSKTIDSNMAMLTACNPNDDFFLEEMNFRKQLPFKEGVLSRFDILIPLTATQLKNELLVDRIDIFGTGPEIPIDFEEVKDRLVTLAKGMKQVKFVILTEEQKTTVRDAFKAHNTADRKHRYIKNRPLVILRDLESLARLVNTITTVNFSKRKVENGMLHADDDDIDKAIQLWENLLVFRIQLYARSSRNLMTVSDEILAYLARVGGSDSWIPVEEALNEFVMVQHKVGRTTFYKEITGLIEEGRIIATNKRNRKIRLVIK